jgi:hypothetical protein
MNTLSTRRLALAATFAASLPLLWHEAWAQNGVNAPGNSPDGVKAGAGFQCIPWAHSGPSGPIVYRVDDIGKPGVGSLSPKQRTLVDAIRRGTGSTSLYFVVTGDADLIVFDTSPDLLCTPAGRFTDLARGCTFYEPTENPEHDIPMSGCYGTAEPWLSPDVDGRWRVYALSDVGRPGVPALRRNERTTLSTICKRFQGRCDSLRWTVQSTRTARAERLVVWDAASPVTHGYRMLNASHPRYVDLVSDVVIDLPRATPSPGP